MGVLSIHSLAVDSCDYEKIWFALTRFRSLFLFARILLFVVQFYNFSPKTHRYPSHDNDTRCKKWQPIFYDHYCKDSLFYKKFNYSNIDIAGVVSCLPGCRSTLHSYVLELNDSWSLSDDYYGVRRIHPHSRGLKYY